MDTPSWIFACVFDPIGIVFSIHSHSAQDLDIKTLKNLSHNLNLQSQIIPADGDENEGRLVEKELRGDVIEILSAKERAHDAQKKSRQDTLGVHRVHVLEAGR